MSDISCHKIDLGLKMQTIQQAFINPRKQIHAEMFTHFSASPFPIVNAS